MKTIQECYQEYEIFRGLQEHQLRVAAVGKMICDSMSIDVDTPNILHALLLHDMGNLIKVKDFTILQELFDPEGSDYWETKQQEFFDRYGSDEHKATEAMAREIGVDEKAIQFIGMLDFGHILDTNKEGSIENKICTYADRRVSPAGIVSLEVRMDDALGRYKDQGFKEHEMLDEIKMVAAFEEEIFSHTAIDPHHISELSVQPFIKDLKSWSVT